MLPPCLWPVGSRLVGLTSLRLGSVPTSRQSRSMTLRAHLQGCTHSCTRASPRCARNSPASSAPSFSRHARHSRPLCRLRRHDPPQFHRGRRNRPQTRLHRPLLHLHRHPHVRHRRPHLYRHPHRRPARRRSRLARPCAWRHAASQPTSSAMTVARTQTTMDAS